MRAAPIVTTEMANANDVPLPDGNGEKVFVTMENLFLYTLNELEGNLGYLITHRFASHTLRVLLVILAGLPLAKPSTTNLLQSKRKEKIDVLGMGHDDKNVADTRVVPESFGFAVDKIIEDSVKGLDTTSLRSLATHQNGNPMLQLMVELELTRAGKSKGLSNDSLLKKLLPDDLSVAESPSASFINGLMYDPIGSRLLESIVRFAPGKTFKALYKSFFRDRIGSLARNETAGWVVSRVLERLSREDLEAAVIGVIPQIPGLVERGRTNVIKTLVERCATREVDTAVIADVCAPYLGGFSRY
jgi:nucleolar protein 9